MPTLIKPLLADSRGARPRAAIFLSGSGSNAERLLEDRRRQTDPAYDVVALVTDAPAVSRALAIGQAHGIPVVANDIRAFYRERGETRVSLATPAGRELRDQWTAELRRQLAPYAVDFGVLAGFVPLTNLTGDFPCLNVHPGDLTYLKNGQRYLVGLHTVPIERAILEGLPFLRSSVIQSLPYTGIGDDMDNGPLLGISAPVPVNLPPDTGLEALRQVAAARPPVRPPGGYKDALEAVAKHHQERLKEGGDWLVFPPVVAAFAQGRYALAADGGLLFRGSDGAWNPVETLVYTCGVLEILPR